MDDLISRKRALEEMTFSGGIEQDGVLYVPLRDVNNHLKSLPSVQPERKKGKWTPVDSFSAFGGDEALWMAHGNPIAFYYCSNCKEQAYAGEDGQSLITDFCPNCGADMKNISEDPEDACSGCDYYDLEDNNCRVFECFGIDCPRLPCEEETPITQKGEDTQ